MSMIFLTVSKNWQMPCHKVAQLKACPTLVACRKRKNCTNKASQFRAYPTFATRTNRKRWIIIFPQNALLRLLAAPPPPARWTTTVSLHYRSKIKFAGKIPMRLTLGKSGEFLPWAQIYKIHHLMSQLFAQDPFPIVSHASHVFHASTVFHVSHTFHAIKCRCLFHGQPL